LFYNNLRLNPVKKTQNFSFLNLYKSNKNNVLYEKKGGKKMRKMRVFENFW
jgi:predicted CopG family antitoxin